MQSDILLNLRNECQSAFLAGIPDSGEHVEQHVATNVLQSAYSVSTVVSARQEVANTESVMPESDGTHRVRQHRLSAIEITRDQPVLHARGRCIPAILQACFT